MFDENELEELYDDFLSLDGDMFLEAEVDVKKLDNDILTRDTYVGTTNIPSNLTNNNFLGGTGSPRVDKPDVSIQLDLLNQNFISLDVSDFERKAKSPTDISDLRAAGGTLAKPTLSLDKKVDEVDNELKEVDEKLISPSPSVEQNAFHRVGWAPDSLALWHSGPSSFNLCQPPQKNALYQDLSSSITCPSQGPQSFGGFSSSAKRTYSHQQLGAKVEMVYSLLSMLDTDNREDMSKTFLAMSSSPESCHVMRQSGCLPLLIQLIHSSELDREVRNRAAEALHNVVHAQTDEKRRKREIRVLKLLQQVREYCDELRSDSTQTQAQESDKHPINATGTLMKLSFDAEHRQAICVLGGLHAITDLIQVDHKFHGSTNNDGLCITLRRYAGMSLTNLTFGDGKNKALLCSFSKFLLALTDQLKSPSEDLRQVTASVLRNLSWRADSESKQALRDVGAVTALTMSAMEATKESTLKSILSALWNLSAHCSLNKIDICAVPGALAFFVKMLKYKSASNTLAIIENAGGILRNVSSHIAFREDYRQVLRDNHCFEVLLEQLRSPSLTIVSNACGTLWNLSARCTEDQRRLWEMGATSMLRSLVQSKHKMISMGSSAALKNLLAANPNENLLSHLDSTAKSLGLQNLPTLFVRKKRALEQELNITLAETCENIEPAASSSHTSDPEDGSKGKSADGPKRSESHDSLKSTQSDTIYELINQMALVNEDKVLESGNATLHDSLDEKLTGRRIEEQKLMKRYSTSMIPTPTSKKITQDRINEKTRHENSVADDSNGIPNESDIKELPKADSKQKNKKGIPVRKTPPKKILLPEDVSHEQGSSLKLAEENSLDHGNAESLEGETVRNSIENHCHTVDSPLNPYDAIADPNSNYGKSARESSVRMDEIRDMKRRSDDEKEEEREGIMCLTRNPLVPTRNGVELSNKNSLVKMGWVCGKTDSKEPHDNLKANSSGVKMTESESTENGKLPSRSHSKNPRQIIHCIPQDSIHVGNDVSPLHNGSSSVVNNKEDSTKGNVKGDLRSNYGLRQHLKENISIDSSSDEKCKLFQPSSLECLKETSKKLHEGGENQTRPPSGDLKAEFEASRRPSLREWTLVDEEVGCKTDVGLQPLPEGMDKCSAASRTFEGRNGEMKNCDNLRSLETSDTELNDLIPSASFPTSNRIDKLRSSFESDGSGGAFNSYSLPFKPDTPEKLNNVHFGEVGLKASSACILPSFKVGSPITDTGVLQMEARKVCGEIQKHRDFEMGCSLNSEISLVSCSSFLDSGDCSLFDSSTDATNFDEYEMIKAISKTKDHSFPKSISQHAEPVSLPSLGSLKNDHIEALDLDNSVLSVASITSEIDENYTKDQVHFDSYANTYKVDGENGFPEETSADATLVSRGDDDTLNMELLDDDNSLHSQENLPLDTASSQDCRSDRPRTKLTPKEKRKHFHDRYRTYTIRDFKGSKGTNDQGKSDNGLREEAEVPRGCGVLRSHVNGACDSYETAQDIECNKNNVEQRAASNTFYCGRGHEPLQFSKSFDRVRDSNSEFIFDSRSLNDLLSIGPSERKELVDNAKLVAFSLKTAVHHWDTEPISDSEAEDPPKSSDIDTATYTKAMRNRAQTRLSFQELETLQSFRGPTVESSEKTGAKICKPGDKPEHEATEELSRGIRGRRKPLYSSPQKTPLKTKGFSPSLPSAKTSAITDTKKPLPHQSSRSPSLHREGTFTKEDGFIPKKSPGKGPGTMRSRSSEFKIPVRAAPKNKSLPSEGNGKTVGERKALRVGRPLSTYASRNTDKRMEGDSSQRRPFSAGASSRTVGEGIVTGKKPVPTCSLPQKMRSSSSSQNMRTGNSPNGSSTRPKNLDSQSGKSHSDASLNLVDSKERDGGGKSKASKREVVSRIAGLWKKVEETKKNKNLKDNRVWIGPEKNNTSNETLVMEKEEILHIPTRTIVHSFTCQALTQDTSHDSASQQRNWRNADAFDESGAEEGQRGRGMQRRGIISAVVAPYNYNPPMSSATPSGLAEVDNFQKSSLKVTTV